MNRIDPPPSPGKSLTKYAWLSVAAAIATITLKAGAFYMTGSVGLLSDALESLVNLAGAIIALTVLAIAARPPDDEHAFGHGKFFERRGRSDDSRCGREYCAHCR